jgi:hypothetical protein
MDHITLNLNNKMLNKIFSGWQPCQLVKRWKKQRFEDHLCPRSLGTDVSGEPIRIRYRLGWCPSSTLHSAIGQAYTWGGLVLQTHQYPEDEDRGGLRNVGFSPFNQLTRLSAREDFIIQSRREIYKSYNKMPTAPVLLNIKNVFVVTWHPGLWYKL